MLLKLLNAGKATQVGMALADAFVLESARRPAQVHNKSSAKSDLAWILQSFLQRVDREARSLQLNILKRATLTNSFKRRLIEQGVERRLVDELTQALVVRLATTGDTDTAATETERAHPLEVAAEELRDAASLFTKGNACMTRGEYADAAACYDRLLAADPEHVSGRNNFGAALFRLGRYEEAEEQLRRVLATRPHQPEAHCHLGIVLRWRGRIAESERHLRQALELKPTYIDAQLQLSTTLLLLSRWREARALLESVRKRAPDSVAALVGLAQIVGPEGNFVEAEGLLRRAIELDPHLPGAWAGLARLRRMTPSDRSWLERAEEVARRRLAPLDEADIRYAIGKYYDDTGDFEHAFRNYQRANELQKTAALPYDRAARVRFVDGMTLAYTRALMSTPSPGASDSAQPIFVVGMPRSGTSLVEQILASHPEVKGAGEFGFWQDVVGGAEFPGEPLRRSLAAGYLRALASRCPRTARVVDKTTLNSDYLGLIHAVFPHARIIYVRRNPIDVCLSCYFQEFSSEMNFALDLSDLAHYYRQHARLVAHWHQVLPEGSLLEVKYEQLVGEQETWTRRILGFLGLEWDARCLDFHKTERAVMTASFWQVRQEMYRRSGGRWRNYKRFIGPLLELRDLDAG